MKKLFIYALPVLFSTLTFADEPVVVAVKASAENDKQERNFHVTLKHGDEGWDHYADGFEIITANGTLIAKRVLHHPHVNEQPFTREKFNVKIPHGLKEVHVHGHDSVHGYGSKVVVAIPGEDQPVHFKN